MASTRSDGLGFLDRLVILVAWLASCGVVFVIGYYVGKDAVPPSAGITPGVIQVPVAGVPVPPDEPGAGGTFYESLGRQTGSPGTAPPAPRVTTTAPAREASARPTTTTAAPARSTTTTAPGTTTAGEIPGTPSASGTTTTVAPSRPATTTTRPPGAAAGRGGGWTVYVSPTRERFEAERQRAVLRAAGYDASVVPMQRDGDVWYRVRAGRFDSEASAEQARRDLRERGIGHAFVQSE